MREILFRGKCLDNGEWVEGNLITGKWYIDEREIVAIAPLDNAFYPHCEMSEWYEVDPSTVGQFTGLADKNGKRIFEGDIIKTRHGVRCIVFDDGCFGAQRYIKGVATLFANLKAYNRELNGNWEVIGNIHDNPELLEGET